MYRRILGIAILFLLCFSQSADAQLVPIVVKFKINGTEEIHGGSGFVAGIVNDKSIIVTAGHVFPDCEDVPILDSVKVQNEDAKLIYRHFAKDYEAGDEDLAILEVDKKWTWYNLEDPIPDKPVKVCGIVETLTINLSGFTQVEPHAHLVFNKEIIRKEYPVINGCIPVPGQSGGPILMMSGEKEVCIGIILGIEQKAVKIDGIYRAAKTGYGVYLPSQTIRAKLDIIRPGWNK